jgi:hypothetical protein
MAPLIEELQVLWRGVVAYDVAKVKGKKHFILQAMLMWTIHDYLAYGLVAGCVHQGYKACQILPLAIIWNWVRLYMKVVIISCQKVTHIKKTKIQTTLVAKKKLRNGPQLVTISGILKNASEYGD